MTNHQLRFVGLVVTLVVAGLLTLYALAGFLLVPWLAQRQLPQYLEETLGRGVSIDAVAFNPFLLQANLRGVHVEGRHGSPMLASERLYADLALSGLFSLTWTVDELRVEGLRVHLVMAPDGSLNLNDMASRFGADANASAQAPPPAVLIRRLSVPNASLVFTDLTGAAPATASIDAVNLEAEGITTTDQGRARHQLTAQLPAGGTLRWTGELVLQPSISANGEVQVKGLTADTIWPFLRDQLALSGVSATAALAGRYTYEKSQSLTLSNVTADITDVVLAAKDSEDRLLTLGSLKASGGGLDLARQAVSFSEVALRKGQARLAIAPGGRINWAGLLDASAAPDAQASRSDATARAENAAAEPAAAQAPMTTAANAGSGWSLAIDTLRLAEIAVNGTDRSRAQPLALAMGELNAQMKLTLATQGATQVVAEGINGRVNQVSLGALDAEEPAITVASASLENGRFDLQAQQLGAKLLAVDGGQATLQRQPDGRVPLLDLLTAPAAAPEPDAAGQPWGYALDAVRVSAFNLQLSDESTEPPLAIGAVLQASATSVATDQPASFDASLAIQPGGGKISATGSVAPGATSVQAQVALEDVALVPLQPLLAQYAALSIQSGAASASLAVQYQQGEGEPLQASGSLGIADLLVNEATSGDRFLSWQQLDAQGVDFALGARTLLVKDVEVDAPGAKIVIAQDRSVNIAQVFKKTAPGPAPETVSDRPPTAEPTHDGAPPFDFRIEQLKLSNGVVDYADLSLVLPFSTQVTGLQGVIADITSDPARRAGVKASGEIQPYGSARVDGSIVPFNPSNYTNLQVVFNNVLVPPLSPYTATFAGRKVESGRLWLDLDYKVEGGKLLGSNDIRLTDFTLGEPVEAPGALNVPLNLAVALLTDSKGQIKLSVPVRGDLESPRFSVADAVKQAVGNVLQRLVTAPFRALGNLFGGKADALASIEFRPGSADLNPEQREALDALSQALQERPKLQLVVDAPHDPQADAAMLKRQLARRELAAALGRPVASDEDPGPIAYDDPATRRALERMLKARTGAEPPSQSGAETSGDTNTGEGTVARGVYQDMFARIASAQPVTDTATRVLATQRARTISQYLQQHGVAPARVQTGRIAEVRAGSEGSVAARLQIAALGDRM